MAYGGEARILCPGDTALVDRVAVNPILRHSFQLSREYDYTVIVLIFHLIHVNLAGPLSRSSQLYPLLALLK
jgi:hypothetical protein